jgi:hypothetical protein
LKTTERVKWIAEQAKKLDIIYDNADELANEYLLTLHTALLNVLATDEQWEEAAKKVIRT